MLSAAPSNVLQPLLTDRTLPQIFSPYSCAICQYLNEDVPAKYRCVGCAGPEVPIYYCAKHVRKVPEHQNGHRHFHEPDEMFKELFEPAFKAKFASKLSEMRLGWECEVQQVSQNSKTLKNEFDARLDEALESFLCEMEAHRQMLHIEIERTAAARRQALDKIVAKLDEESKLCKDFVDDIEYDSIEFIQSAGELLTEVKSYSPEVGPLVSFLPSDRGAIESEIDTSVVRMVPADSVNRYWRDVSAVERMKFRPAELKAWNLRDMPVITVPHPDFERHGQPMMEEMFLIARKAVLTKSVRQITEVVELEKRQKNDIFMLEGPGRNCRRVALRYLTETFESVQNKPALELVYEPRHLSIEQIMKPMRDLTMRKLEFFYKLDHFGEMMNTFICFFSGEAELKLVKSVIDNKGPKCWEEKYGIQSIQAFTRGKMLLSFLDDPVPCPRVVSPKFLSTHRLFECPPELLDLECRPPMSVELWLDMNHPSTRKKGAYEPMMKQIQFAEMSFRARKLIETARDFRVQVIRQVEKDRIPWAWVASVKAGGENVESKLEGTYVKRSGPTGTPYGVAQEE